jgi:hypothetical protein
MHIAVMSQIVLGSIHGRRIHSDAIARRPFIFFDMVYLFSSAALIWFQIVAVNWRSFADENFLLLHNMFTTCMITHSLIINLTNAFPPPSMLRDSEKKKKNK